MTTTAELETNMKMTKAELSAALFVSRDALKKWVDRNMMGEVWQLPFFTENHLKEIFTGFAQNAPRRKPETMAAAQQYLSQIEGDAAPGESLPVSTIVDSRFDLKVKTTEKAPEQTTKTNQRGSSTLKKRKTTSKKRPTHLKVKTGVNSHGFLMMVFVFVLLLQIKHTGQLLYDNDVMGEVIGLSQNGLLWLKGILAFVGAMAVHLTALLLTIHNGSKQFLYIYLVLDFTINMIYYEPWTTGTWESWSVAAILSFLISFAIFAYSDIYTQNGKQ